MRVLSLLTTLDPELGGTQSAATNMLISTQRAGILNTVVAAGSTAARLRAGVLARPLEDEGVTVEQFSSLPWPPGQRDRWGLSPDQAAWLGRRIGEFDLLHIHGAWGLGLLTGLAAARLRDTPIVVTPHESLTAFDIDDSRSGARRREKLLLKRLYLRWTTLFVVASRLEAQDSLPTAKRDRARVVRFPVIDDTRPLAPLRPRGAGRELRVGFLGRIQAKKNLRLLIDALAELPEHVQLLVAGGGTELAQEERARAATLGVDRRVEWLGYLKPHAREQFLDNIDLLAMPSAFESFGMSAAEAMSRGVPVVIAERTGVAEVTAEHGGGLTVPPNASGVAAAIRALDADRDRLQELGSEAEVVARTEFGFSRSGEALSQAYADALK